MERFLLSKKGFNKVLLSDCDFPMRLKPAEKHNVIRKFQACVLSFKLGLIWKNFTDLSLISDQ